MRERCVTSKCCGAESELNVHTCWNFAGFAVRAGQPDGFDVLTQCKGCEFGLDVQVLMADSAKILDLNDELCWNAVETRLSHHFVFAVSVWLPSVVTFGDLRLHSVGVPDVHGKAGLSRELKARVLMDTLAVVRKAAGMRGQVSAGRPWLLVSSIRCADQPSLLDMPEIVPAYWSYLGIALVSVLRAQNLAKSVMCGCEPGTGKCARAETSVNCSDGVSVPRLPRGCGSRKERTSDVDVIATCTA